MVRRPGTPGGASLRPSGQEGDLSEHVASITRAGPIAELRKAESELAGQVP